MNRAQARESYQALSPTAKVLFLELCQVSARLRLAGRFVKWRQRHVQLADLNACTSAGTMADVHELVAFGMAAWVGDDLVVTEVDVGGEVHHRLTCRRQAARRFKGWHGFVPRALMAELDALTAQLSVIASTEQSRRFTDTGLPRVIASSERKQDLGDTGRKSVIASSERKRAHTSTDPIRRSGGSGLPLSEDHSGRPPPPPPPDARARAFGADGGGGGQADAGELGTDAADQLERFAAMWPTNKRGLRAADEVRWWKYSTGMLGLSLPLEADVFDHLVQLVRAEVFDGCEKTKWPRVTVLCCEPSDRHRTPEASKVPALLRRALERAGADRARRERKRAPEPAAAAPTGPAAELEIAEIERLFSIEYPGEAFPGIVRALARMEANKSRPRAAPASFAARGGGDPSEEENGPQNASGAVLRGS